PPTGYPLLAPQGYFSSIHNHSAYALIKNDKRNTQPWRPLAAQYLRVNVSAMPARFISSRLSALMPSSTTGGEPPSSTTASTWCNVNPPSFSVLITTR